MSQGHHENVQSIKPSIKSANLGSPLIPQPRITKLRRDVANVISSIVHPLLFPLLVVAVVSYNLNHQNLSAAISVVLITIAITSLPVALVVWIQVRRGAWTDFDVSQREQRFTLYPFTLICLAVVAYVYARLGANYAVWCVISFVIANIVNGIINLAWKISAHTTTASACATLLWFLAPAWGPPAAISALLVGWSRVELRRHTVGQVIGGWIVGTGSSLIAMHFYGKF